MSLTFPTMLRRVLQHEGGYVDHPKDPGGATNKGVTQRTYDAYRYKQSLSTRSVRQIEEHEVFDIYREGYFQPIGGAALPPALAFQVFDFAVNSGPVRAVKYLQRNLGVAEDGVVGPKTISAAKNHCLTYEDTLKLIDAYLGDREDFLKGLETWKTFGAGWSARINQNWQYAKADAHEQG